MSTSLRFPTSEFRSIPYPNPNGDGRRAKIATCFVPVKDVPLDLKNWMQVNPRIPTFDNKDHLKGPVAKAMIETLLNEPELFELKNQGMYILAEDVTHEKGEGGAGVAIVKLSDLAQHGLVNGGHTFLAIREAVERREAAQEGEYAEEWNAHVRLHIMVGIEPALITDIAEGLNKSLQVNNPSLENLRGTFNEIKKHMDGKRGAGEIAYRQGDTGDVDILHVLTCLAMFNLDEYRDRKKNPHGLFGHPKAVLETFTQDLKKEEKGEKSVFKKVIPKVHEIMVLADRIQQEAVKKEIGLGKLKVSKSKKGNRVRSDRHKGHFAHFAGATIDGNFPLGWLYPMLAAFRSNVSRDAWEKGKLEWMVAPEDLLKAVVEEMATIVKQEHTDNKEKPAEVGRKEAAYRGCYGVMTMELAKRKLPVE